MNGALAFSLAFEKGRGPNEDRAKVMGNRRAELAARRINNEGVMGRFATRRRGAEIAPRKIIAPVFPSQDVAKAEFSAVIIDFSDGEIALDANVSKETVKTWKKRRAFPQGQVLMDLAFNNSTVQNWVLSKLGASQMPEFRSPEMMTAAVAAVYRLLQENSPDGDAMRAAMNQPGRDTL